MTCLHGMSSAACCPVCASAAALSAPTNCPHGFQLGGYPCALCIAEEGERLAAYDFAKSMRQIDARQVALIAQLATCEHPLHSRMKNGDALCAACGARKLGPSWIRPSLVVEARKLDAELKASVLRGALALVDSGEQIVKPVVTGT